MLTRALSGGKMLRPKLVILSAYVANPEAEEPAVLAAAEAAELIHCATLAHDDVLDESDLRRGKETLNKTWGTKASVLLGDYLLARVFALLTETGKADFSMEVIGTCGNMICSEIDQSQRLRDLDYWRENYDKVIRDKTASFMSVCCKMGAAIAGGDAETADILARYGVKAGMAFQIADDLLDMFGAEHVIGKPRGSDLREGKYTLPVLIALDKAENPDEFRAMITAEEPDVAAAAEIVRKYSLDECRLRARKYAEEAAAELDTLTPSEHVDELRRMAFYFIERCDDLIS